MTWSCKIESCSDSNVRTTSRDFIFKHYCKHLRSDVNATANQLGIVNPNWENRYSLINEIISKTKETEEDV